LAALFRAAMSLASGSAGGSQSALMMLSPRLVAAPPWHGPRGTVAAVSCRGQWAAVGSAGARPKAPRPSLDTPLFGAVATLSFATVARGVACRAVARRSRGGSRGGEESLAGSGGVLVLPMDQVPAQRVEEKFYSITDASPSGHAVDEGRWRINLLYDGDCHVCRMQVEFLTKRMDENPEYAGLIRLTNLADPDYDPEACGGVAFEDGMRHIHAVTRDGEVVTGVEVFRHVYRAVGMEWVYSLTSIPFLGPGFDWLYDRWAENRLLLTGRADVLEQVHEHQKKIEELSQMECDTACAIDWD